MYLGRVVESGPREALFFDPKHPYTEALLAAVPSPDPTARQRRVPLGGDIPSPASPPPGCAFHPRCPRAMARCAVEAPHPTPLAGGHVVACHLHEA
jgi:peptide/nickel transport system ATP-binding protein/oligopeptide transport system ATP-binding protein